MMNKHPNERTERPVLPVTAAEKGLGGHPVGSAQSQSRCKVPARSARGVRRGRDAGNC